MKALGTGMAGAAFKEIAILSRDSGEPYVELSGNALETAGKRGIASWHISITHSKTTAAASWNVTYRPWLTAFAPLLTSFSCSDVK